jgi:glycosyltransferase involved in cell wall biosynthesis
VDRGTAYLFITSEGIPPTVFDSQVLEPLLDLARNGLFFDLLVYRGLRGRLGQHGAERSRVADVTRALSPGRVWLHSVPFPASRLGIVAAAVLAASHLAPSVLRGKNCVCHCRGHLAGFVGVWIKRMVPRCRIVFDMRGDEEAETPGSAAHPAFGSAAHPAFRREVARVVASACRIVCVSESFRRQVAARYPEAANKISVIPCTASAALFTYDPQTRRQVRRRLGLDDRLVLVYCGGLAAPWHVADRLVAAFGDLHAAHPTSHLLLVTPDVDLARGLTSELGIDGRDVTVVSASHPEVPSYLMAADVGLLFRRRDSVNAVASPTKLAEYLMTGLPVAVSEGIGDSDGLFSTNEFGALIRDIGDPAAIDAAVRAAASVPSSDESRAARAAKAADLLSSERYLPTRLEVYAACQR